jgi:predicted nucleotidyltransferase
MLCVSAESVVQKISLKNKYSIPTKNVNLQHIKNDKTMYIDNYMNALTQLCIINKVKSLYVFGSALTSRFDNNSDIDLIVDIDSANPLEYADCYFNLKFALQDLFNRPIDLLENKSIKNKYLRHEIENSKQLIYAV